MTNLAWKNASKDNPGFSVWHATPKRDPNVLYVIRQKRKTADFTPTPGRRRTPARGARGDAGCCAA